MAARRPRSAFAAPAVFAALAALASIVGAPAAAQPISALKDHDVDRPIEIAAQRLEVKDREDLALFIGDVIAEQGDLTMRADELTVFYTLEDAGADPTIRRLDATGTVALASPSERATASWGVYDVERRIITLGGGVRLVRGETELAGDRLEIDLATGVTKLDGTPALGEEGRVRGRFALPENDGDEAAEEGPEGGPPE